MASTWALATPDLYFNNCLVCHRGWVINVLGVGGQSWWKICPENNWLRRSWQCRRVCYSWKVLLVVRPPGRTETVCGHCTTDIVPSSDSWQGTLRSVIRWLVLILSKFVIDFLFRIYIFYSQNFCKIQTQWGLSWRDVRRVQDQCQKKLTFPTYKNLVHFLSFVRRGLKKGHSQWIFFNLNLPDFLWNDNYMGRSFIAVGRPERSLHGWSALNFDIA